VKGYRVILFNLIMGVAGLVGLNIAPAQAQIWVTGLIVSWAFGGVALRFVTNTPVFQKLSPEGQKVVEQIIADAPKVGDLATQAGEQPDTDAPEDLVSMANSILSTLKTVQGLHDQVFGALKQANDQVTAAFPAGQGAAPQAQPQPQNGGTNV